VNNVSCIHHGKTTHITLKVSHCTQKTCKTKKNNTLTVRVPRQQTTTLWWRH